MVFCTYLGAALLEEQISALKEALAAKQAALQELGKDPGGRSCRAPKGTTRAGSSSPSCPAGLHGAVASPEMTKKSLLEDLKTTMVARSQVLELEEEVRLLTDQKESLGQELSVVTTQLEKEKAKVESVLRHREVQLLLPEAAQLQPQPLITAVPLPRGSSAGSRAAESCCSPCRLASSCSPCRPSRTPCCSSWTAWTRSVRSCKPAWGRPRGTGPGWRSSWRRAGSSGSRAGTSSGRCRYPGHGGSSWQPS